MYLWINANYTSYISMCIYNWRDPNLPIEINPLWTWERHPLGVKAHKSKTSYNDSFTLSFTSDEWDDIHTSTKTYILDAPAYRYKTTKRRVIFGWENIQRKKYKEVMHIRGIWDGRQIKLHIPKEHWLDILDLMEISNIKKESNRRLEMLIK